MAPREALDAVDRLLRDFMQIDEPFGGKVLVMGGDFRQVLPVMPRATRAEILDHSLQQHPLWRGHYIQVRHLTANMRARGDDEAQQEWRRFLLTVGDGTVPVHPVLSPQAIRLPDDLCAPPHWGSGDLAAFVFPNLADRARTCVASPELAEARYHREEATTKRAVQDYQRRLPG